MVYSEASCLYTRQSQVNGTFHFQGGWTLSFRAVPSPGPLPRAAPLPARPASNGRVRNPPGVQGEALFNRNRRPATGPTTVALEVIPDNMVLCYNPCSDGQYIAAQPQRVLPGAQQVPLGARGLGAKRPNCGLCCGKGPSQAITT